MAMFPRQDPPPQQPPEPDLGQIADSVIQMAETLGGQRRALMAQGFTEREAALLVVSAIQQFAAQTWKEVGLQWGLSVPE